MTTATTSPTALLIDEMAEASGLTRDDASHRLVALGTETAETLAGMTADLFVRNMTEANMEPVPALQAAYRRVGKELGEAIARVA